MELLLFYKDLESTLPCIRPDVSFVIIDWENKGKDNRQINYNTQINYHTVKDLEDCLSNSPVPVIVRINGYPNFNVEEIEMAIQNGASEILLPMVQNASQVDKVLKLINQRCKLGILIETEDAVKNVSDLTKLDLSRIYIGLNDLKIDRKTDNLFMPIIDGTIEKLRASVHLPFGYGGLTHPDLGSPIPCNLLLQNMVKNSTDFTFLRRSFYQALQTYKPEEIFESIKNKIELAKFMNKEKLLANSLSLKNYIKNYSEHDNARRNVKPYIQS